MTNEELVQRIAAGAYIQAKPCASSQAGKANADSVRRV